VGILGNMSGEFPGCVSFGKKKKKTLKAAFLIHFPELEASRASHRQCTINSQRSENIPSKSPELDMIQRSRSLDALFPILSTDFLAHGGALKTQESVGPSFHIPGDLF
jgi:hypothetical protein